MNYATTAWPMGTALELIQACIFPTARSEAADITQPFTPDMVITRDSLKLFPPERAVMIRPLDGGRHILCRHSSGVLFISRPARFRLLPIL